MQRRPLVGRVDGDAASMGLDVERRSRSHEGADIGDRVADAVPLATSLDVHRLVEVTRSGRVDRHERKLHPFPRPRPRRDIGGFALDLGRERLRHPRLGPDRAQAVGHALGWIDSDPAGRHQAGNRSLTRLLPLPSAPRSARSSRSGSPRSRTGAPSPGSRSGSPRRRRSTTDDRRCGSRRSTPS